MKTILSSVSSWFSEYKVIIIVGVLVTTIGGAIFAFNSHVDSVRLEARRVAIAECNTTQLEEDLRAAEVRNDTLQARIKEIEVERNLSEQERADLQRFIDGIDRSLGDTQDGEISERTRLFMTLLSQRSARFHEDD
jgi:hypothetical protein